MLHILILDNKNRGLLIIKPIQDSKLLDVSLYPVSKRILIKFKLKPTPYINQVSTVRIWLTKTIDL